MGDRVALGRRLRELRNASGLTLEGLSQRLRDRGLNSGSSKQHLSAIERGDTWPSREVVQALDEEFHAHGALLQMLREAKVPESLSTGPLCVTGHLFYPLHVDRVPPPAHPHVPGKLDFVPMLGWTPCPDSAARLYSFPFKVVVLCEAHDLAVDRLSQIATWRRPHIDRCASAASKQLEELGASHQVLDHEPYCFTAFACSRLPWADEALRIRAVELLSMPRALLSGDGSDAGKDQQLLYSTTPIADVVDFSLAGSHVGFASWAAVAAMPVDDALDDIVEQIVAFEIQLQAIWCYASNVENSRKYVSPNYSAEFLEDVLRKLGRPWPTEHTAQRRLREALIQTSRIDELIRSAVDSVAQKKKGSSK
jgi:hypothetical protein